MTDTTERLRVQIAAIKTWFHAKPDAVLTSTTDLRETDFAVMGKLIQLYYYVDLNARRIIDALRHAALGPEARYASRLEDAQGSKLREIASE